MKFLQLVFFWALSLGVIAQNSINYISPDFAQEDNYFGTKNHFLYDEERGIRLNSSSQFASELKSYLSTECQSIDDAQWELSVKINATTSSGNFVRYYIVSDNSNLSVSLNGYFVMIGNTEDEVSLYRQTGSTKTKIIDGADARVATSTVNVAVKVTRSKDGKWTLYSKLANETAYTEEGSCIDNTHTKSDYCGVYIGYSLSNNTKYSFNDWIVSGEKAQPQYQPKFGDIAFNELMVKPSPAVGLPEEEYIEIVNLTEEKIDLNGIFLCDASKKYAFPSGSSIAPGAYALLCTPKNTDEFAEFGDVITFGSLPALTDGGKLLWIENSDGTPLCWVEYSDSWSNSAFKANGGWALECIDATNKSNNADNWKFSESKRGGTPAQKNSISAKHSDEKMPQLININVLSSNTVQLLFDETMDIGITDPNNYNIENESLSITRIEPIFPKLNGIIIYFDQNLTNEIAGMTINASDYAGNKLPARTYYFSAIAEIETNDFIINEFLIGQKGESVNFIEIYNSSTHLLDVSNLYLCSRKDGELSAGTLLANEQTLILPHCYTVITTDTAQLKKQYDCGKENAHFIEIKSLSEFSANGGNIVLVKRNAEIVDETTYTSEMCASMTAKDGIASAERDYTDLSKWHSSSENATPGRRNSDGKNKDEDKDYDEDDEDEDTQPTDMEYGVTLQEKSFSPNGDGYRDMLKINCMLQEGNGNVTIDIYTAQGALVKHLAGKTEIDGATAYEWDGTDNNGKICNAGLYLIYAETLTSQCGIKRYKLPFAITKD
ncbi:MAG: lamin tail domain-containing protein [Paludibacteraceae bacterium]|nr:lamin tail domain-containing protein [Paludibacteraceae bacterium]